MYSAASLNFPYLWTFRSEILPPKGNLTLFFFSQLKISASWVLTNRVLEHVKNFASSELQYRVKPVRRYIHRSLTGKKLITYLFHIKRTTKVKIGKISFYILHQFYKLCHHKVTYYQVVVRIIQMPKARLGFCLPKI